MYLLRAAVVFVPLLSEGRFEVLSYSIVSVRDSSGIETDSSRCSESYDRFTVTVSSAKRDFLPSRGHVLLGRSGGPDL